jgi:hypothetical protein
MERIRYIAVGLVLSLILFASCEDYYHPVMDITPGLLVVDSHMTNDPNQNFVRLSKARNFYSTSAIEWASGAVVELVQDNFQKVKAKEDTPGYYIFPSTPVPESKYLLRITYQNNVYESDYVVMPPVPAIDSLYTSYKMLKQYQMDAYGKPQLIEKRAREIEIDVPISPKLEYYRFSYRAIIQWKYTPPAYYDSVPDIIYALKTKQAIIEAALPPPTADDTSIHVLYGWISKSNTSLFDLAGPKEYSSSNKIKRHPLVSLAYKSYEYLDSAVQEQKNWIFILDQYGISKESYNFHEKLNQQFSAEGSLFDPVLTQVSGNIRCKSDPTKIVLGYFDLNSYKQYRYYLNLGTGTEGTVVQRRLTRYFDIPDRGYVKDNPPIFWETNYNN